MLEEQKIAYETLLNPNADLPTNSRRPRCFIGVVEHFLPYSQQQDSSPTRTTDRITVYQHNDSEQTCTAGAPPPPCPGTRIHPQKTYYAETRWSGDGVPMSCRPIEATTDSLQRIGLCLVAMPSGMSSTDGYEVTASQTVPVMHCSSPDTRHAREACAISAMVQAIKHRHHGITRPDDTDVMTSDEDEFSSASSEDSSQESYSDHSSDDASPISSPEHHMELHDPSTWVFPPSDNDSDEDTWSTGGNEGPECHLRTGIEQDPAKWIFPEDSDDDTWSSDEE